MFTSRILIAFLALTSLFALTVFGQQKGKAAAHVLMGKVEVVNETGKSLTVNHQKVEGYMEAMTMPYKVDKPDVFKKVKVGDQIKATVYNGDYTLYDIEVLPPAKK